ncbi:helix-turn-helix domain-containing protein [Schlesneria paludicola]|uniref:helix-turn-helix domain-containing protein n=1 Tax=Schlesneria paludicola TaxID=360056 RepID=UPI00029A0F26|nr:AraC family transcriptional regulator [Schlesneria paludicola]
MSRVPIEGVWYSTSGPWFVNAPQPLVCSLGQIVYAGTKWNSRATYAHAAAPDFMRPTTNYLIVLTLEGEADYVDSTGVRTILREGTLVWARPGVQQSYGPRSGSRWSELYMWFSGPAFETWQEHGFPGERTRIMTLSPLDYWVRRFRELVQPMTESPGELHLARFCQFQQILADAVHFEQTHQQTEENVRWREQALRLLDDGNMTSPSLEEIAQTMSMSYTAFRKRFAKLTGKSPGQHRSEVVIRRACSRLLMTDESLAQIADGLGFYDSFHFSRRFKQIIGMAPTEFRRQRSG